MTPSPAHRDGQVVKASNGGHGLSTSYIGFTLWEGDRYILSGGIDKEGAVST